MNPFTFYNEHRPQATPDSRGVTHGSHRGIHRFMEVPLIENSHSDQPPEVLFVVRSIHRSEKPLILHLYRQCLAKQGVVLDQPIYPGVVPILRRVLRILPPEELDNLRQESVAAYARSH